MLNAASLANIFEFFLTYFKEACISHANANLFWASNDLWRVATTSQYVFATHGNWPTFLIRLAASIGAILVWILQKSSLMMDHSQAEAHPG